MFILPQSNADGGMVLHRLIDGKSGPPALDAPENIL
jgi:hypothetical protein